MCCWVVHKHFVHLLIQLLCIFQSDGSPDEKGMDGTQLDDDLESFLAKSYEKKESL